jgi:phage tail-like protein
MGLYNEMDTDNYIGAFNFRVSIPRYASDINQAFVRVSGVVSTSEPMEFAHGTDPYVRKSVGRTTYEDVTLERIYNGVDSFYEWRMQIEAGSVERHDVKIELLKPDGTVSRTMICRGAWPSRWELPEMDASGSQGATERIGLTVENVTNE